MVAIGSNTIKRQRAAEIALVVALDFYPQFVQARDGRSFQARIHLLPFENEPAHEPLALSDAPLPSLDGPHREDARNEEQQPGPPTNSRRRSNKI